MNLRRVDPLRKWKQLVIAFWLLCALGYGLAWLLSIFGVVGYPAIFILAAYVVIVTTTMTGMIYK